MFYFWTTTERKKTIYRGVFGCTILNIKPYKDQHTVGIL